uniref:SXP/RAL-2 family protein Ani s 5-like cation-binding domain-containing protein n=1 Tax=Syphacia muris TaxID=451379 RepID=A0A0N5A9Y4_9BILA
MKLFLLCLLVYVGRIDGKSDKNTRDPVQSNTVIIDKQADKELSNCFGKVKSSLGLYRGLRNRLDIAIRQARIDVILEIFKEKIPVLCAPSEAKTTLKYLKRYTEASTFVSKMQQSLTESEKSQLNQWRKSSDTIAETEFYLRKYKELPNGEDQIIQAAYVELMNKFVQSSIKREIAKFLNMLKPDKINELKSYGKAGKTHLIRTAVDHELNSNKFKASIRNEIIDFSEQLFSLGED